MSYSDFIASKLAASVPTGLDLRSEHDYLDPFQRDLVTWALRRGRAAIFASTGLGKTRMQLAWASAIPGPVLILAPLAVAQQTVEEGRNIGVEASVARDQFGVGRIAVTNYERIHKFDPSHFAGVVLDESSIIKHHDAKTLASLMAAFGSTPYKLCATATPAPNDFTELGTHAEFLGVCTRAEMLSEYFVHDGGDTSVWRLKGHAREPFWRWVATWGAMVRSPADLGYDGDRYRLPELVMHEHIIRITQEKVFASGFLFATEASGLMDRRRARRESLDERVAECVAQVKSEPDEPWVVWCDLNDESEALAEAIPNSIEIRGSMPIDRKEQALTGFARGQYRVLVSKPRICGWGLNWQHAARMAFVGVTDSWEAFYQAVRREWRFGQKRPVHVHVFASESEGSVLRNLQRKEAAAQEMGDALTRETAAIVREQVHGLRRETNEYKAPDTRMPEWMKARES